MAADPIMDEIFAAFRLMRGGDRLGARSNLEAIWSRIEPDPEPMHEVALSHYMADAQDDPADSLAWNLRALDAIVRCTDSDVQRHSTATSRIAAFLPSAHLNLGLDYFKLGDFAHAKEHLDCARSFAGELADDAYGQNIRRWIERLAKDLEGAT